MNANDPDADLDYIGAAEKVIQRAMTYMGENRALQIASSVPIDVDSRGNIEEVQTENSGKEAVQYLLDAYKQVVGTQLVVNIINSALSGQLAQKLERLCTSGLSADTSEQVGVA